MRTFAEAMISKTVVRRYDDLDWDGEYKYDRCDIAASHMARKTFIGNLYKKVQVPNIVDSLSGHVECSRAFSRYRKIDKEIKTNV